MIETTEISKFLTPELCEDAGIIVIKISDETLDLGAMNLDYIKVKKVIKTIENEYSLKVSLKQITSLEWETWFENNHATSVEKIQKNSAQNQVLEEIINEEDIVNHEDSDYDENYNLESIQYNLQNSDDNLIDDEKELIDDAND